MGCVSSTTSSAVDGPVAVGRRGQRSSRIGSSSPNSNRSSRNNNGGLHESALSPPAVEFPPPIVSPNARRTGRVEVCTPGMLSPVVGRPLGHAPARGAAGATAANDSLPPNASRAAFGRPPRDSADSSAVCSTKRKNALSQACVGAYGEGAEDGSAESPNPLSLTAVTTANHGDLVVPLRIRHVQEQLQLHGGSREDIELLLGSTSGSRSSGTTLSAGSISMREDPRTTAPVATAAGTDSVLGDSMFLPEVTPSTSRSQSAGSPANPLRPGSGVRPRKVTFVGEQVVFFDPPRIPGPHDEIIITDDDEDDDADKESNAASSAGGYRRPQ